jgi:hypothetical protein
MRRKGAEGQTKYRSDGLCTLPRQRVSVPSNNLPVHKSSGEKLSKSMNCWHLASISCGNGIHHHRHSLSFPHLLSFIVPYALRVVVMHG